MTVMIASTDWTTVSSLATAGGTLVLAIATFASVRSANRAARTAEHAFDVGVRPVLFASRLDDSAQKIRWGDDHWVSLGGGRATFEAVDGVIYLALSLRNVGGGIAVMHSWRCDEVPPFEQARGAMLERPEVEAFRLQSRDLYIPAGDMSFWQAAIRDHGDPDYKAMHDAIKERRGVFVDLLYSDHEGHQRTISRFTLSPLGEERTDRLGAVIRHWNLDRPDPRDQ